MGEVVLGPLGRRRLSRISQPFRCDMLLLSFIVDVLAIYGLSRLSGMALSILCVDVLWALLVLRLIICLTILTLYLLGCLVRGVKVLTARTYG